MELIPETEIVERIYNLKMLETLAAKQLGMPFSILRVPGGWIFLFPQSQTFVPFNNEFQEKPKSSPRKKISARKQSKGKK